MSHATAIPGAIEAGLRRKRLLAVGAMVAAAACWGLATVMSKRALDALPPFTLLVAQLTASVTCLWSLVRVKKLSVPVNRRSMQASLCGVLEPGLAYALGINGLLLTSASSASLIGTTEPILVVVLAYCLFRTSSTRREILAIAATVLGVAAVTASAPGTSDSSVFGDMLIVVATAFAALYVVVSERFVVRIDPLLLAALQQTIGLAVAVIFAASALLSGAETLTIWPSGQLWILIITSGVIQYALAFWLYLYALKALSVGTAAMYLALIPVFGVGGAVLFLGEGLGTAQLVGSALIIAAIVSNGSGADKPPESAA